MNRNIRIAKELVRIARMMIAAASKTEEYFSNVREYINECFTLYFVTGSFGIKYKVRYDTSSRDFNLTVIQGAHNVPSTENVEENLLKNQIIELYNDAVREVNANYDKIDGYDALSENEKENCLNLINANCLVDPNNVSVNFFNSNDTRSDITQKLDPDDGFNTCE